MTDLVASERAISFGPFRLVPTQRLLLEDDNPVRVGSRALDILTALVERPGELVGKDELIDQADQAHLLDRRDEFAAGDQAIVVFAHPQQALEIIDLPRGRTYHRLKGEKQTVLAQRIANRLPDRRITLPGRRRRAVVRLRRTSHHTPASPGARY